MNDKYPPVAPKRVDYREVPTNVGLIRAKINKAKTSIKLLRSLEFVMNNSHQFENMCDCKVKIQVENI